MLIIRKREGNSHISVLAPGKKLVRFDDPFSEFDTLLCDRRGEKKNLFFDILRNAVDICWTVLVINQTKQELRAST
jgi:hypothetical protein